MADARPDRHDRVQFIPHAILSFLHNHIIITCLKEREKGPSSLLCMSSSTISYLNEKKKSKERNILKYILYYIDTETAARAPRGRCFLALYVEYIFIIGVVGVVVIRLVELTNNPLKKNV
jgi:hypothetical protein